MCAIREKHMMRKEETTLFSDCDGLPLSLVWGYPERECKGVVQLVHGMSEHKERYLEFMEYLAQHGYICVLHDHRGHGKSVRTHEDLGYLYDHEATYIVEDVHQINTLLHAKYPKLPVFLFGHSMGSLVVRAYCKRYDDTIDGLLVCGSPSENKAAGFGKALVLWMQKRKGDHYRSSLIQKMAFGKHNHSFSHAASENTWLCSDASVVRAYDEDPLCGFVFTLNGFANLFALMQKVYDKKGWSCHKPQLPIRFIAGREDPCIISEKAFQQAAGCMREAGYTTVTARLFDGMRHEILNEVQREMVYEDVVNFLEQA